MDWSPSAARILDQRGDRVGLERLEQVGGLALLAAARDGVGQHRRVELHHLGLAAAEDRLGDDLDQILTLAAEHPLRQQGGEGAGGEVDVAQVEAECEAIDHLGDQRGVLRRIGLASEQVDQGRERVDGADRVARRRRQHPLFGGEGAARIGRVEVAAERGRGGGRGRPGRRAIRGEQRRIRRRRHRLGEREVARQPRISRGEPAERAEQDGL